MHNDFDSDNEQTQSNDNSFIIRKILEEKQSQYSDYYQHDIFIASWNVNARSVDINLSLDNWLLTSQSLSKENSPDLYVIGLQEVDPILSTQMAFSKYLPPTVAEKSWCDLIERFLSKIGEFQLLTRSRLGSTVLFVYINSKAVKFVPKSSVLTANIPTGFWNMGNKGAAAVRFQFRDDYLCFVNAHLSAGENNMVRRNQDATTIFSNLVFDEFDVDTRENNRTPFHKSDFIFFFGDLNYRTCLTDLIQIRNAIKARDVGLLIHHDELFTQLKRGQVFSDYEEARIVFLPTYKFCINTDIYDFEMNGEKCRLPSYCDRILWKKNERIKSIAYQSAPDLSLSDHKPVFNLFTTEIKSVDKQKWNQLYHSVIRDFDGKQNSLLPQASLSSHDLDFGEVKFFQPKRASIFVTNTGIFDFFIDFKPKSETEPKFPEWLTLIKDGSNERVPGGKTVELVFEVFVNPSFVRKFYTGEYNLENDILILTLRHGKHFFITTHGRFCPTSFGLPLGILLQLPQPVASLSMEQLIDKVKQHLNGAPQVVDEVTNHSFTFAVPKEIYRIAHHVFQFGLEEDDLLRQPSTHVEQIKLIDSLDNSVFLTPLPADISVHTVMETLLMFLQAMYEPVIPAQYAEQCFKASKNRMASERALAELPYENQYLFVYLTKFLHEIHLRHEKNQVDIRIIVDMFGGTMFRDNASRASNADNISSFISHFLI